MKTLRKIVELPLYLIIAFCLLDARAVVRYFWSEYWYDQG